MLDFLYFDLSLFWGIPGESGRLEVGLEGSVQEVQTESRTGGVSAGVQTWSQGLEG